MNDLTAVWGQGLEKEMNLTLAFVLDMGSDKRGKISLSAASCFKILADGVTLGFGPNRAAHGYARISEFSFNCRYITVEVHSHYVLSFCW
ncbi:MAG: hypothetical protein IJS67_04770, partial [Clostridia bacterium]|nr:hypothetical protein [Clostridia bacterium]